MPKRKKVDTQPFSKLPFGNHPFDEWEIDMVERKAKALIGTLGITKEETEDVKQELFLQILHYRKVKGSTEVLHHEKSYLGRILDNRIRNLLDERRADKRRVHAEAESLSQELMQPEGVVTLADILAEDDSLMHPKGLSMTEAVHVRVGVRAILNRLTPLQKKIARLFMKGHSITETALILGLKRAKVKEQKNEMKNLFSDET